MTAEAAPTAATLLRSAKAALVEFGWVKGEMGSCDDGFCALGAFYYTDALMKPDYDDWRDARDALNVGAEYGPGGFESVISLNDAPGTTLEDVLNLFDRAIERVSA